VTVTALTPDDACRALVDVASARRPQCGSTHVLAIDGHSGTGKTGLAVRLAALVHDISGEPPLVLHLDDVYPGWNGLNDTPPALVRWVLQPLSGGELAAYHRWDWRTDSYAEWVPIMAGDWLIIEGSGSAARACAPYLSGILWLDADPAIRRERALARDGETYRPHWERWAAQEKVHFSREQSRSRADVILDTTRVTLAGPERPHKGQP
jgi:energy-coupling factor transporter ATP-binding protein EcfA2